MTDAVFITGGLGYLGGRITLTLAKGGNYYLRLGTRRLQPCPPWLQNGCIVQMDLMSDETLDRACEGVKVVVHLASINEIESQSDPERAMLINGLGTLKMLRAAERAGVQRFIYFSTAHIYGSPLVGRISEQTLPRPLHPYAISHRVAEDFVLAFHDQKKMEGIVVRLSNGLGSPLSADVDRWTLIANDLCRQAVISKKMALRSSGLQQRDFITLHDVGRAVLHFLTLPASKCDNGLFNLGGESSLRIIDLAQRIASRYNTLLGFTPEILRLEPKENNASQPLDYRIDKLKGTHFTLTGNWQDEIDATIRLCEKSFKKAS